MLTSKSKPGEEVFDSVLVILYSCVGGRIESATLGLLEFPRLPEICHYFLTIRCGPCKSKESLSHNATLRVKKISAPKGRRYTGMSGN